MDRYLQDEMRGAMFCDPHFVENFLTVKQDRRPLEKKLKKYLKKIPKQLDSSVKAERELYGPILDVLQTIKEEVDDFRKARNLGVLGTEIQDYHTKPISGDDPDSHLIKPDMVLFEGDTCHWDSVMMPIEVKAQHAYLKVGMKQLARYTRAVFAHQLHRRHLYGMVICQWAATFVRFDRSGMMYSEPIDMLDNTEKFLKAFSGLMMLDRRAFGYDTAFTTERLEDGRLGYYIDLPGIALASDDGNPDAEAVSGGSDLSDNDSADGNSTTRPPNFRRLPSRRFKVMERLCHRKSIRGRATIVLRVREVRKQWKQPKPEEEPLGRMTRSKTKQAEQTEWVEVAGGRDYVLKLMWRDPKKSEGEILENLVGEYGVAQCKWYSDVLQWDASCHEPTARTCEHCCDMTPAQALVRRVRNLEDLDVEVAQEEEDEEEEGKETKYVKVEIAGYNAKPYRLRKPRIYSWALFSTVGKLLWNADSPRQLLGAVLDAILGYWHVVNREMLHRDISDGNVLIAEPGESYDQCNWKTGQGPTGQEDHPLAKSRRLAYEMVMKLGRDPSGFLNDYDLATTHSQTPAKDEDSPATEDVGDAGPDTQPPEEDEDSASISCTSGMDNTRESGELEEFDPSPKQKVYNPIDFRTGTPTFMSVRVLRVELGTPYRHHFMDDLESFFWLILWCVVEHTDTDSDGNGGKQPTRKALNLLHQLDRADSDFETLANSKTALLHQCADGGKAKPCTLARALADCRNAWSTNSAIVHVIVHLGIHFSKLYFQPDTFSECTPVDEFPELIGIINEGLQQL